MRGFGLLILLSGLMALGVLDAMHRASRRRSTYRARQYRGGQRVYVHRAVVPAAGARQLGWIVIVGLLLISLALIGVSQAEMPELGEGADEGIGVEVEPEYIPNPEPARMTRGVGSGWGCERGVLSG